MVTKTTHTDRLAEAAELVNEARAEATELVSLRDKYLLSRVLYDLVPVRAAAREAGVWPSVIVRQVERAMTVPGGQPWKISRHTATEILEQAKERGVRFRRDAGDELPKVRDKIAELEAAGDEARKARDAIILRLAADPDGPSRVEVANIIGTNPSRVSQIISEAALVVEP